MKEKSKYHQRKQKLQKEESEVLCYKRLTQCHTVYAVTLSNHLTHDEREESNIVIEDTESILRRQRGRERVQNTCIALNMHMPNSLQPPLLIQL